MNRTKTTTKKNKKKKQKKQQDIYAFFTSFASLIRFFLRASLRTLENYFSVIDQNNQINCMQTAMIRVSC